jgi:adenylate cyclase
VSEDGDGRQQGEGPNSGAETTTERVAAILAADAVGYSRLMADDEKATIAALDRSRAVFTKHIEANRGRVVDTAGDSVLAVFETTNGAVRASVVIQEGLAKLNERVPEPRQMQFRIGIHLGDIHEKADGTVYGDGVNIAARLEGIAEPGGITVSEMIHGAVAGRLDVAFTDVGEHEVKNIAEPVRTYRVLAEGEVAPARQPVRSRRLVLASMGFVVILVGATWWQMQRPEPPEMVTADGQPTDDPTLAMPQGPSIAVMPFDNLSDEGGDDVFARGLAGDISVQLSRQQSLRTIGRSATQRYAGQDIDVRSVAEELAVDYLLLGTVRRSASDLRISTELLASADGSQIWAETYDRDLTVDSIFGIQDDITQRVIGTISDEWGVISQMVRGNATNRGTDDLSSYECVLTAFEYLDKTTPESHLRARDCLEETIERDPLYADAWGALALIYAHEEVHGFNPLPNSIPRALATAERGVRADDDSQMAWLGLAAAYYFAHDQDKFIGAADKALAINPNDVSTLAGLGFLFGTWGMLEKGLRLTEKAIALSPFDLFWYYVVPWIDAYSRQDYETALAYAHKYNVPGFWWTYMYYVPAYAQLGQMEEAKEALDRLRELKPDIAEDFWNQCRYWNMPDSLIAHWAEGFRKAGLDIQEPTN